MRFIVVEIKAPLIDLGPNFRQWRATHVKDDGNPIDVWFWAADLAGAKQHVRDKYPDATFSDERLH
jgi:hypothetical protein